MSEVRAWRRREQKDGLALVALTGLKAEAEMVKTLKAGDAVSWKSHGGEAHGKVVRKITSPTQIKTHKVAASKDSPEFLVETGEGKLAAHKAGALSRE